MINPKSTQDEKINFIINNFPQAFKANIYTDVALIKTIRTAMFEQGLYSRKQDANCANIDSAIINYILKAKKRVVKIPA